MISISEVLEHLENPRLALSNAYKILSENGTLYISVPINSPAPDHIYLLKSLEEVKQLVVSSWFYIVTFDAYPASGYSLKEH